jgi:hypothetical protein
MVALLVPSSLWLAARKRYCRWPKEQLGRGEMVCILQDVSVCFLENATSLRIHTRCQCNCPCGLGQSGHNRLSWQCVGDHLRRTWDRIHDRRARIRLVSDNSRGDGRELGCSGPICRSWVVGLVG